VVAAVNVSAPVRRGPVEQMATEILPALLRAAREIEADLARTRA
jgi:IclR family pca regulon transcriptional regulator